MVAYLLDTNHASPLVTPQHPLRLRILQRLDSGDSFALCVPVVAETLYGVGILPRALQNRAEWTRLQPFFPCYIPDDMDATFAADLQIALRRQDRQLATVDVLIAVVALRYDLILLTTDQDFHAVPRLQYENWRETVP